MVISSPIESWAVVLDGEEVDLSIWESLFKDRSVALILRESSGDGRIWYCLHSSRLDGVENAQDILSVATALVERMNGAVNVWSSGKPVTVGNTIIPIHTGGERGTALTFMSVHISARSTMIATLSGGTLGSSDAEAWLSVADGDNACGDALVHFGRMDGWFDLYKVLEVIEVDVGGRGEISQRCWATRKEVNDLGETANHYRHARSRSKAILAFSEARDLMARIMRQWLEEKRRSLAPAATLAINRASHRQTE
jgi:hypothetical protein